ncbi:hypothetical protein [Janthinobacterium sp. 78]|uniref:hypothetical protein n=1 Tax=Janthinobacterium sp. 78 TaxID=2135631 RepID=UPI000D5EE984|nr:hypothetical protein [Janthinobacterium sp. 78]PVX35030.1 hypothetical protein C8C92_1602 [Janthinobacterium sp. 78]
MPVGLDVDGIIFSEVALVDRPSHAAALGRIFTSWSLIEASIASLLGLMMHTDHNAALALLGTFKSNSARIDAIRKTGKQLLDASLFKEFDDVMKDVLSYAEERNAIAHGVWGSCKEKPEIVYRMPMNNFTRFLLETANSSADEILGKLESFKTSFTTFTLDNLERIEQQGRDVLSRAMAETMKKSYSLALEKQTKAK